MVDLPKSHPWLYGKFSNEGLFVCRRSHRYWAGLSPDLTIEQVMMRAIKSREGLTRGSGLSESVRVLWVYSMHAAAAYHNALINLSKLNKSKALHNELGESRLQRDFKDLMKIKGWLDMASHDPFDIGSEKLRSLDSGLIAGDDVNCDEAEMIGSQIQQSLDNLSWNNATVKRSLKAVTLASLKPSVKINDEKIVVDPLVLFSRLIILMHRYGDISCFFDYELSPVPTSLFDGYLMRKSNKSSLAKGLDKLLAKSNEEVI